jgi:hypothetical protein
MHRQGYTFLIYLVPIVWGLGLSVGGSAAADHVPSPILGLGAVLGVVAGALRTRQPQIFLRPHRSWVFGPVFWREDLKTRNGLLTYLFELVALACLGAVAYLVSMRDHTGIGGGFSGFFAGGGLFLSVRAVIDLWTARRAWVKRQSPPLTGDS